MIKNDLFSWESCLCAKSCKQCIKSSIQTEEETSNFFSLMLMGDRSHLAWPQIITVMTIMDKMLLPQNTKPPLRRRISPQTGTAQPTATDDALICYYHQRFGDKAHLCRDPCALLSQCKVVTLVSGKPNETQNDCVETEIPKLSPSRLLYVAEKRNKCNYLIDTGAAVSVLPRSCANGTVDADSLPLVAANN